MCLCSSRAGDTWGITEAVGVSAMCSTGASPAEQGWVKAQCCPAKRRQCPIYPSLHCSSTPAWPSQSMTVLHRVKASKGLLGFSRGLTIISLPRALLLPWVQQGVGAEVLEAVVQSRKLCELPRARDLFCPLPHNLGNETFLPVLLHLNYLNCQFFGIGIIHP